MSVEWTWQGAVTDDGVLVVGKITGASATLSVASDAAITQDVATFGPATASPEDIVRITASGLVAGQRWYWRLDDGGIVAEGTFRTLPTEGQPASFRIGVVGDAGQTGPYTTGRVSNAPVFDELRERAIDEEWLLVCHTGDLHYLDVGDDDHIDYTSLGIDAFRQTYDRLLTFNGTEGLDARQRKCWSSVPIAGVWDDHDYGPNSSDRTAPGRDDACAVYRERAPHYPLTDPTGIWQSWKIGRVLFIASDVRSDRDPNDDPDDSEKGMLGPQQEQWLYDVLDANADAPLLIWVMPKPFPGVPGGGGDSWGRFGYEARRLIAAFRDGGWVGRMLIVSGDSHVLALDTGKLWEAWDEETGPPSTVNAALEAALGTPNDLWDRGNQPGVGQYGTVDVVDIGGDSVHVTWTGWEP